MLPMVVVGLEPCTEIRTSSESVPVCHIGWRERARRSGAPVGATRSGAHSHSLSGGIVSL